jgi:hypothetical protein
VPTDLPPQTNIKILFGNWLNRVANDDKVQIRAEVCALLWATWNACYPLSYLLDPYVVLFSIRGQEASHAWLLGETG